jgi:uncharacterized UBP type Zn finger protein
LFGRINNYFNYFRSFSVNKCYLLGGHFGSSEDQPMAIDWKVPHPPGIANSGQTCYLNAFLQILASVPDDLLEDWTVFLDQTVPAELKELASQVIVGSLREAQPQPLDLSYLKPHFLSMDLPFGQQHDPSELLVKMFPSDNNITMIKVEYEQSYHCMQCYVQHGDRGSKRDIWDTIMTVEIGEEKTSLERCLSLVKTEFEQEACRRCQGDMVFQYQVRAVPPLLFIRLNRYRHGPRGQTKKTHHVDFSPGLKIHDTIYTLVGVVVHLGGTLRSGHYIAYRKWNNEWFLCDDSLTTHTDWNTVRSSQAFILLYAINRQPQQQPGKIFSLF